MKASSSSPRKLRQLSASLTHDINLYALGATAVGVSALALTPPNPAEAKIVYTPAHIRIAAGDVVPIDVNHDGINDLRFFKDTHTGIGKTFRSVLGIDSYEVDGKVARYNFDGQWWPRALKAGVSVGKQLRFDRNGAPLAAYCWIPGSGFCPTYPYGAWARKGKGLKNHYLGLEFKINGRMHYGWARLTVDPFKGGKRDIVGHLTGYAYETVPNKPIITGKTKGADVMTVQPLSLGHLARGASLLSVNATVGHW